MYIFLGSVYGILVLAALVSRARKRRELDLLPSLCWTGMMAIPFVVQVKEFSHFYVPMQAAGIFLIGFVLLIADFWEPKLLPVTSTNWPAGKRSSWPLYAATFGIVAVQVTHVAMMPKIPLLEQLRHNEQSTLESQWATESAIYDEFLEQLADVTKAPATLEAKMPALVEDFSIRLGALKASQFRNLPEPSSEAADPAETPSGLLRQRALQLDELHGRELLFAKDLLGRFNQRKAAGDPAGEAALAKEFDDYLVKVKRAGIDGFNNYLSKIMAAEQTELQLAREYSSKLLNVPQWFIYVCQNAIILSPVVVVALAMGRSYLPALGLLLFSLLYSKVTLARGPILILGGLYIALAWSCVTLRLPRARKPLAIAGFLAALPLLAASLHFLLTNQLSIVNFRIPTWAQEKVEGHPLEPLERGQTTFTVSDHSRKLGDCRNSLYESCKGAKSFTRFEAKVQFLTYRIFYTPSEVSHRWYTFFPDVSGGYVGLEGLTPGSRNQPGFQHPANRLGRWAYVRRFPLEFGESIMAYASVDADANARGGLPAVILVACLLFGIRMLIKILRDGSFLGTCLYISSVVVLAMNLPNASLQAILAAHGLALFICMACVVKAAPWVQRLVKKRHLNTLDSRTSEA